MKHILNTLSKSFIKILIVIVLIVIQVNCDLALPEYTSKIVNVGIQQSGITDKLPKAITERTYNHMAVIANTNEIKALSNYNLIKKNNPKYIDEYPILNRSNIYVLNKNIKSNKTLSILYITAKGIERNKQTDLFKQIPYMDPVTKSKVVGRIKNSISKMNDTNLEQIGIGITKNEYKTLGLDIKQIQTTYIIIVGLKMLGIAFFGMLVAIIIAYLSAMIAASFAQDIRKKLVTKVMSFTNKEFQDFSTASLITRSTNDIQQLQMVINMALRILIYAPILGVGAYMKVSADQMSWVIGVSVIAISMLVIFLFSVVIPKFQLVQKLMDKLNLITREIITGISVIRAFATHKKEEKRFDEANLELTKTNLFVGKIMSFMMPAMFLILNATTVLIIWVGADKVNETGMQVGTLIAFMAYTMQIIMAFLMISMISIMLPRAGVSLKRIKEVLNKPLTITDPIKPLKFNKQATGTIEFNDVSFKYCDTEESVLCGINFQIKPGTTNAIIGSTGSGKSTLAQLMLRFFDPSNGSITIDGVNIKNVSQKDLRNKFGYVPQKPWLFSGNIESNLKFGVNNATPSHLNDVIKISQADEFIKTKKDKLKTYVAQGGSNLSGGQKQRLAIARAIMKKPEFLIFDDSFSALDFKTDTKLRKALAKNVKESTIIIVAQRISSILSADQIIVLDQGKVAGIGTHQTLIKDCKVYQEIAKSQLSKEELSNVG